MLAIGCLFFNKMLEDRLFTPQEAARQEHARGPPVLSAVRRDLEADCGEIQPSAG
jgi:hypothetical protein